MGEMIANSGKSVNFAFKTIAAMKKISLLLIVALMALGAWAQEIKDGDTFFDGWNYYTAEVRHSGVIHFIDNESDEDFTIQKVDKKKGEYKLIPERQADDPKFGCQWEARVQFISKDNVDCLAFYPEKETISCLIPRVHATREQCEKTQESMQDCELKNIVSDFAINRACQVGLSRAEIEPALGILSTRSPLTLLESVNKQLLTYALAHADDESESDGGRFIDDDFDGDTDIVPVYKDMAAWHASSAVDVISGITNNMAVVINGYQPMNLSEVLNRPSLFYGVEGRGYFQEEEEQPEDIESPLVISKEVYEGRELIIRNIHGLTLRGESGAHLVVDAAYANVLSFENCDNIRIENLTLGHAVEKGTCTGGVIYLRGCSDVEIVNCDLYGCGTYGIEALDCSNVKVDNTVIRDCSDGGVNLSYTDDAHFTDCDIVRCGNGDATVTALFSNNMTFDRCRFAENTGSFLFWLNKEPVTLNNCEVHYMNELSNKQSLLKGNTKWHKDANPLTPRAIGPK